MQRAKPSGPSTSVSQMETYRDCPRKWFFKSVLGYKIPPHPAAELGIRAHAAIEHYLRTGNVLDNDEKGFVMVAMTYLPPPGLEGYQVEASFETPTYPGGPIMFGFKDLEDWRDPRALVIADHKFKSSMSYNKTDEELRFDLQMNVYAWESWASGRWPTDKPIIVKHLNQPYRGTKRVVPVLVELDYKLVSERWRKVALPLVEVMEPHRRDGAQQGETYAFDTWRPADRGVCMKYGGCPFLGKCKIPDPKALTWGKNLSSEDVEEKNMSGSLSDFFASQTETQDAPKAPPTPPQGATLADAAKKIASATQSLGAALEVPPPPPPDKGPPPAPPPQEIRGEAIPSMSQRLENVDMSISPGDEPEPTAHLPKTEAEPDPGKVKRGVGRPRKIKVADDAPSLSEAVTSPAPTPATSRPADAQTTPATAPVTMPAMPGFTLFVDVVVAKGMGPIMLADDWVAPILQEIADAHGVVDFRLIQYEAYNLLAMYVRKRLNTLPPALHIRGFGKIQETLLSILVPHATTLIMKG